MGLIIAQVIPKEKPECKTHKYSIIRDTGIFMGVPIWICTKCGKKVFSM